MHDQRLIDTLGRIGKEIAKNLPDEQINSSIDSVRMFPAPALYRGYSYRGIDPSALPKLIYGNELITTEQAVDLWNECFRLVDDGSIFELIKAYFPRMPVVPFEGRLNNHEWMCRIVLALSWHLGPIKLSTHLCQVKLDRKNTIGFEYQGVDLGAGRYRRMPDRPISDYLYVLMRQFGLEIQGIPRLCRMYSHIQEKAPKLLPVIEPVFGAAVYAGSEAQLALLEHLPISPVPGDDYVKPMRKLL